MKRGGTKHIKMKRLARQLDIPLAHAVGLVELLLHVTDQYAPRGDVGRFTDEEIAIELDWAGDPAALVGELCAAGWLDPHPAHRLVVHDWPDHCPDYTKKRMKDCGWAADDEPPENADDSAHPDNSGKIQTSPDNSGLPFPSLPSPPKPNTCPNSADAEPARSDVARSEVDGQKLAEFFAAQLREHGIKRVKIPPNLDGWGQVLERMVRLDEIPAGEIASVIRWVVRDDFERTNVLSPDKLRKRYPQLLAKAKQPKPQSAGEARAERERRAALEVVHGRRQA